MRSNNTFSCTDHPSLARPSLPVRHSEMRRTDGEATDPTLTDILAIQPPVCFSCCTIEASGFATLAQAYTHSSHSSKEPVWPEIITCLWDWPSIV